MHNRLRRRTSAPQDRNIKYRESGNLMEMVSQEVCLHSADGCMAGKLVLVVGGEGQVKARGSCS